MVRLGLNLSVVSKRKDESSFYFNFFMFLSFHCFFNSCFFMQVHENWENTGKIFLNCYFAHCALHI